MSHAEQLEQETEQTRAEISRTLDELRASMTPGRVIDQLADRVRDGAGAAFARNLKNQTVSHPLPIVMIGAGVAWLMLSSRGRADGNGRAQVGAAAEQAGQSAAEAGNSMQHAAGSLAESAQRTTAEAADAIKGAAGSATESMQHSASAGYEAIAGGAHRTASALSESTKAAGERTWQLGDSFLALCREQPLMLAGLGVAVGALTGALLPSTEIENRLMGETSDRVKDKAQDVASEQIEDAKQLGEDITGAGKDNAHKPASDGKQPEPVKTADETSIVPKPPTDSKGTDSSWPAGDASI